MRTSAALAGTWALLLATPLWAQEPRLDHLGLDELLQIRVSTSTQTPVALQAAPSTIYRYSGDELRRWGMRRAWCSSIVTTGTPCCRPP